MNTTAAKSTRIIAFALTTALASTTLAGCAGKAAPSSAMSAAEAKAALAKGKSDKAVTLAEAAVLAAPRDAAARTLLGTAYVEAGRFASAATALGEAMQLGDTQGRTVLTYSLALSADGRYDEAQALLDRYQRNLDPADFGLAITLAGRPQQGVQVLSDALRSGTNTMQVRQNLAYAFALMGDWRSARLVAAQDLQADQLDQRLGEWAQMAMPQMAQQRVAALLGVKAASDAGQPTELALANFPTNDQLAAEAATQQAAPSLALADGELPAAAPAGEDADDTGFVEAPAAPAARLAAAPHIELPEPSPAPAIRQPAPQPARPSPEFAAAFVSKPGAYRVQLGSYFTMADAADAWGRFQKRHPELKGAERVITKAQVHGKIYYRVAAGGFARTSADQICARVKHGGGGCLAYAARTLPGTIDGETRVAAR